MSEPSTTFLNVDLDIEAPSGLDELIDALGEAVIVLHKTDHFCSIELAKDYRSLEETVLGMVDLVRSLSPIAKATWEASLSRQLNIGIQAADRPYAACFTISSGTASLLADSRCGITITVYGAIVRPEEPDGHCRKTT